MRYYLSALALTALASSCVTALGIECQGSDICGDFPKNISEILSWEIASYVSDRNWYNNSQNIVCIDHETNIGSICAYLQGTGGIPGIEVKTLAQRIYQHGCEVCGFVPVWAGRGGKGDNDPKTHGLLAYDWVNRTTKNDSPCKATGTGRCCYGYSCYW